MIMVKGNENQFVLR